MGGIVIQKKSLFIVIFLLVFLPVLLYIVGQRIRLQPKAGGGTDPRAMQPTTLVFPYVPFTSNSIMPGSDRDQYGCVGSAGYAWCASLNKCVRQWEEPCAEGTVTGVVQQVNGQVDTKLILQNISYETSQVSVSLISSDGVLVNSQSVKIPGLGLKEISFSPRPRLMSPTGSDVQSQSAIDVMPPIYPPNYSNNYSALVTSDKGIRGIAQVVQTGGGNFSSDTYQGYFKSDISKKWFFTSRLMGYGRNQTDKMSFSVVLKNPGPMPATYSISVYSLEGNMVYATKGIVSGSGVENVSNYAMNEGAEYGSVVIESDQALFAEGVLKSDKRMSFLKGSTETKNGYTVPFPFNDRNNKCGVSYSDPRPYCGVPTLLIFNPNLNSVKVEVQKNATPSMGIGIDLKPHQTMMYKMARVFDDVGSYSINAQGGVVASVIFESDVYWDTAFTLNEPLADQYFPLWARYKYPFNSTTELVVINPMASDVFVNVDYYNQFGQVVGYEEKIIPAFKKANFTKTYEMNVRFGSARVRSYLPGDKGPGGEAPVLAYMVGGQEVRGSTGSLLAGDGAFMYQGVGYDRNYVVVTKPPFSSPSPWVVNAGWNRIVDRSLPYDSYACLGTNRVEGYWVPSLNNSIEVYLPITPPKTVTSEKMPPRETAPEYMRCGAIFRPQYPPSIPYPMPIPTTINYPMPVITPPNNPVPLVQPSVNTLPVPTWTN